VISLPWYTTGTPAISAFAAGPPPALEVEGAVAARAAAETPAWEGPACGAGAPWLGPGARWASPAAVLTSPWAPAALGAFTRLGGVRLLGVPLAPGLLLLPLRCALGRGTLGGGHLDVTVGLALGVPWEEEEVLVTPAGGEVVRTFFTGALSLAPLSPLPSLPPPPLPAPPPLLLPLPVPLAPHWVSHLHSQGCSG